MESLKLADPEYNKPGRIDILLGVEVFLEVLRQGQRCGPSNSPTVINTEFGWVLAGSVGPIMEASTVATRVVSILSGDDLLRHFWELKEKVVVNSTLSLEECAVLTHFENHHSCDTRGRFIVSLPKQSLTTGLGESRFQAVRRFLSFEQSLHAKGIFSKVQVVMDEYFNDNHTRRSPHS